MSRYSSEDFCHEGSISNRDIEVNHQRKQAAYIPPPENVCQVIRVRLPLLNTFDSNIAMVWFVGTCSLQYASVQHDTHSWKRTNTKLKTKLKMTINMLHDSCYNFTHCCAFSHFNLESNIGHTLHMTYSFAKPYAQQNDNLFLLRHKPQVSQFYWNFWQPACSSRGWNTLFWELGKISTRYETLIQTYWSVIGSLHRNQL